MSPVERGVAPAPAGPPPEIELPPFATHRLDNGMRIEVARSTSTPDVALRLVLGAGAGSTPPERGGLATLACDLLSEGAEGRTAPEMAAWIDGLGAAFHAHASYDAAQLSMHTMNDQLDETLEYLAAVSRRPDFDEDEVERRRAMMLDRLRRRVDDPAEIAADAFGAAVYGAHPYGAPLDGTVESVEPLAAGDLADFWSRVARPDTACLVVCGDVDPATAVAAAEREFGDWRVPADAPPPEAPETPARAAHAGEVILLDRPASRQSELRIGGVGIARDEPDEASFLVANAVLGGLFNSRINLNLREEKGWTYGARTVLLRRRRRGPFLLRTAVATEATLDAFAECLAEFQRLRETPPEPAELELAANALTLSLPLQFQTTSQLARRRAEAVTYDLPDDYWERFPERIRAVSPADVREAARAFLDPGGLVLLAAGDVAGFADAAASLGTVDVRAAGASA
ncbi:MAG: pitrilysin family protein [Gemmatimonadales bacterium]